MNVESIQLIEIFTRWIGFAHPPTQVAKLIIKRVGERYQRQQFPERAADELPAVAVEEVRTALARPVVRKLDPTLFDVPEAAIREHYGEFWTDDRPSHLIRVTDVNSRMTTIRTESQHTCMLPLQLKTSAMRRSVKTFDPRLSRAIAELMPGGYPDKERLAGDSEIDRWNHNEVFDDDAWSAESDEPAAIAEDPISIEGLEARLNQILSREESPAEKSEMERTGRVSERLLKVIPLEDVQELLKSGADANIADDVGQTALMHAAFPPFEPRRFQLLVDAGANLEARRNDGLTGLNLACAGGETRAAEAWIRAGADVNARTPEGSTPLMLAARWPAIVKRLLDAGAEADAVDEDGHSALIYLISEQCSLSRNDQLTSLRMLIDAGTDLHARDRERRTPLDHANLAVACAELTLEVIDEMYPAQRSRNQSMPADVQLAKTIVERLVAAGGC